MLRKLGNPVARGHERREIVAAALCLVNACASAARDGPAYQERPWPVYLGGPARAAGAAESIAADPQPIWHASLGRGITGSPALAEDVLAIAAVDRRVALLDRATGAMIWDRRLTFPMGAGPLIREDRLFVAEQTGEGMVYALRLSNAQTLWRAKAGDVVAPMALEGGALYVATTAGSVGRLKPDSGTWAWRARLPGGVRSAPVPTPQGLVVATTMDSIYLLDAATGAVRVRRGTRGAVLAAPALADSLILIGTSAGSIAGLDVATLETRWSLQLNDPIVGSLAVQGGRAWALTGRGVLCMIPLDNPRAMRSVPLGLVVRAGPSPVVGGVFVSAVNGELVLVDSAGTRRWGTRLEPPLVEPALIDRRTIIATSTRGEVVAFR